MSKRAIFLGSFNPPHKGHLAVIKSLLDSGMLEYLNIDKVHIIPCFQNPNKSKQTPFWDRYKMTTFMFAPLVATGKVVVDDIESHIEPQYTSDMIEYFNSNEDKYIKDDFWWVITNETLQEIIDGKWHNSEQLLYDNNFIIMYTENDCVMYDAIQLVKCGKIDAVSVKINYDEDINYHSTQIRDNIKNGNDIVSMINENVAQYIYEQKLYK